MNKYVSFGFLGFLGLVGLSVLLGSWYTVSEGWRGVVTRNSALQSISEPGLHFKLPWIDGVTELPVQTQKLEYQKLNTYSFDQQQFDASLVMNYSISPSKVAHIFSQYGTLYRDNILQNVLLQTFKAVSGRYNAADIVNHRDRLASDVRAALVEALEPKGFIVEGISVQNIKFTDTYEHAIEAAAQAEANVKKARQELEQAKVDYEKQVADAEAKAKATKARAEAEAFAITAKGTAEASAINARGKALRDNPELVNLTAAEKWDGKLPQTMVPGSAVPFIGVK